MGVESSSRLERPESEADHQPPPSAKVRNEWRYTSTTAYGFMTCTGELREKERHKESERTVIIKEVVGETFICGGVEGRVSLVGTFPGFARSSFWWKWKCLKKAFERPQWYLEIGAAKTYFLINANAHNLEIKLNYLLLQSEEISFDKTESGL